MRRLQRTRAFYLGASTLYAVLVYLVTGVVYQAELIALGELPKQDIPQLLGTAFREHLASFGIYVAFSIIAAHFAYRIASTVTSALQVEERRATDLALVTGLSSELAGVRDTAAIATIATAALRRAVAAGTTVAFLCFDEEAGTFRVLAEDGPGAGSSQGRTYDLTALPVEIRTQTIVGRNPLVLQDTAAEGAVWGALAARFPLIAGARTFAVLPLVSRDRLRAAVIFRNPQPNALPQSRFELATLLGYTIADAVANAADVNEAERRAERESLVNRIAQRARATIDSNEVLRHAVEDIGHAMRTSRAIIALGSTADDLRVAQEWVAAGVRPLGVGSQFVPTLRLAVRESGTIVVHDLESDARLTREPGHAELLQFGTRAVIATPIGMGGHVVGGLLVSLVGRSRSWTGEEVRLVESVANELRVAMELTRLFQARQRETDRVLALHHASAALAGQTDAKVVLDEILKNAVRLLGHGGASLFIWVPEAKILRNVRDFGVRERGTTKMLRPGEGIAGGAFARVGPFIVNDYQHWEGALQPALAAGQQAAIGVPLVRQGEPIGAIVARSYDTAIRYTDDDGNLLTLFADQAVASLTAAEAFEQQRAAVGELERLSKAKSDFISIVSHEFRTPLTGIQGFSEMIRDDDLPLAEMKEYASDINKDAQRLNRMITDMLDLDRMESGRMELYPEAVDLNALVSEVAEHIRPNAPSHPLTLRLGPLPPVNANRDKITQVLTNLLSNAVKYSPQGGGIVVTTSRSGDLAQVSVQDHGLGIPEDSLEKVFERYSRIESGATRHIQGTGLGLPIVRQIIDMHGGRAWVESTLGQGSNFRFTLPLA